MRTAGGGEGENKTKTVSRPVKLLVLSVELGVMNALLGHGLDG
jgi:hypothetical protein